MFERLAKIRRLAPWPRAPRRTVRWPSIPCNDNRPGFRRPDSRDVREHQTLAWRWSLSRDGTRLECRWERAASRNGPTSHRGRPANPAGPSPAPGLAQPTRLEKIAS
jgi:hypothetical protein